ncbi:hypothetical protein EX30DRAFT_162670 [Ascodesmis nigricans]|uniref:Uncharacterized protein n=1 Tax=Ascodesmis nigricans TaxID=341454 RepID=A0A4S2MMJ1_9PEZI|nr:hypothetical protein EX30DRAFT_162670 [Ascodesmis nigricans]
MGVVLGHCEFGLGLEGFRDGRDGRPGGLGLKRRGLAVGLLDDVGLGDDRRGGGVVARVNRESLGRLAGGGGVGVFAQARMGRVRRVRRVGGVGGSGRVGVGAVTLDVLDDRKVRSYAVGDVTNFVEAVAADFRDLLMRTVTFPLVLEEKRRCRRRRGLVVLNYVLLVDNGFVMAFLARVRRREDTYGNRDASVKVQGASLSDSPKLLVFS